ncbi:MAG: hypothetical protein CMN32_02605 [Saprospirales bacterium]|nr:hypothetical protein [Saprospirales bacterium]
MICFITGYFFWLMKNQGKLGSCRCAPQQLPGEFVKIRPPDPSNDVGFNDPKIFFIAENKWSNQVVKPEVSETSQSFTKVAKRTKKMAG